MHLEISLPVSAVVGVALLKSEQGAPVEYAAIYREEKMVPCASHRVGARYREQGIENFALQALCAFEISLMASLPHLGTRNTY